tara:strand:+ start:2738 stop:3958 length:1221 start_codon:yes stop_codon:yes gene_type:complete
MLYSNLTVSTYVCGLSTNIKMNKENLMNIYDKIDVISYEETKKEGLIKVGVLDKSKGLCKKMVYRKATKTKKKISTFRNQIGSYVRILDEKEVPLTQNKTKLNKIKKGSYYIGNRFDIQDQNLFIFKKGQTAFQFNSITLFWDDVSKLNTTEEHRVTTSVARKSQENNLKDISFSLTENDLKKGYKKFEFDKGYYANAIILQSKFGEHFKIKVEFVIEVNMFLFTSGQMKISGCTSDYQIDKAVNKLIEDLDSQIDDNIQTDTFGIQLKDFQIVRKNPIMINCDFGVNIEIKRFELDNLIREKYNIISSYEPNTHPAVKIKYYTNQCYDNTNNGKCQCMEHGQKFLCKGRGNGNEIGECKIVTILVFQSGEIILTGARSIIQSKQGCEFIKNVLLENQDKIKKDKI